MQKHFPSPLIGTCLMFSIAPRVSVSWPRVTLLQLLDPKIDCTSDGRAICTALARFLVFHCSMQFGVIFASELHADCLSLGRHDTSRLCIATHSLFMTDDNNTKSMTRHCRSAAELIGLRASPAQCTLYRVSLYIAKTRLCCCCCRRSCVVGWGCSTSKCHVRHRDLSLVV